MFELENRIVSDIVISNIRKAIYRNESDVTKIATLAMMVKRCAPYMYISDLCEIKLCIKKAIANNQISNVALWEIVIGYVDTYINYNHNCSKRYFYT